MNCLNEKVLSSYLDEKLTDSEREKIESHISMCSRCLDLLMVAYESRQVPARFNCLKFLRRGPINKAPAHKGRPGLKWFFGALFLFILSFVFKRYFLQFLTGSVILGFKWAMEGEGARRAIMIFKGIKDKDLDNSDTLITKRF